MESTLIISTGVLLGCLIALSWFAGSDAPYIPTHIKLIRSVLRLAGLKKGKKFYELGSGDGRMVIEAAKLGAESFGIEQSFLRIILSKQKAGNSKKAHFIHGNIFNESFWQHPLSLRAPQGRGNLPRKIASSPEAPRNDILITDADIVYIYLLAKGVKKLEQKLKKELKRGSIVITQTYHFPTWKPYKKIDLSKTVNLSKDTQGAGSFYFYRK